MGGSFLKFSNCRVYDLKVPASTGTTTRLIDRRKTDELQDGVARQVRHLWLRLSLGRLMPYNIVKDGDKWAVRSESGKTLGRHLNKRDAIQQKIAVEINEGIK